MFFRDFAAFVTKALAHLYPEVCGIDELYFASSLLLFAVSKHPDVGGDASVVEKLLGQGYDGFEPVVLQYPAAYFAFTTASITCEERRTIHNDGYATTTFVRVLHT